MKCKNIFDKKWFSTFVDVIYLNPQMLRSCYGLSTSDVFFQPYSPYRKLLYLPWRDQGCNAIEILG